MFDGIPLSTLTPAALLGLTVLFILLGRLVPRSTLMEHIKEKEAWKKAYETSEKARVASDAQSAQLLELAKTTHSIVYALFGSAERARQSGGAEDVVHQTASK